MFHFYLKNVIVCALSFAYFFVTNVHAQQNQTVATSIGLALDRNRTIEIEKWYNKLAVIELEKAKIRPNPGIQYPDFDADQSSFVSRKQFVH